MTSCGDESSEPVGQSLSIIIPTFNRPDDLGNALQAIIAQSVVPLEVLVVDDSTDDRTERLLSSLSKGFSSKGCELRYIRNPRERGVGIARNVGLESSRGAFVLFTDDDATLQPGFIETLLNVYREHADAVGAQGYLMDYPETNDPDSMYNTLRKMFCLSFTSKDDCRVLRSFKTTYPVKGTGTIPCEWMSGNSQSFRREAIGDLRNDERMKRYSSGDDLDISYNVGRRGKGRLYLSFDALFAHKEVQVARNPSSRMLYFDAIYSYYLFKKNVPRKMSNSLAFYWSRVGQSFLNLVAYGKNLARNGRSSGGFELKHMFRSQLLWLSKRKEIASGDLSFFDEYLNL